MLAEAVALLTPAPPRLRGGRRTDAEEEKFHKKALVTQKAAAKLKKAAK